MKWSSAADSATDYLRDLIHSGVLAPGDKVAIEDLAAHLEVSSTPIRDALNRLQTEGLVEIVPRVGVYIRSIPPEEIFEVYAIKELLEPLMIRWATLRGTSEQRQALIASSKNLTTAARQGEVAKYVDLVEQRRADLLAMANSEVLREVFRAIDGRVRFLRYRNLEQPGRMKESAVEHSNISQAVGFGSALKAATLARQHVRSATRSLRRLIADDEVSSERESSFPLEDRTVSEASPRYGRKRPIGGVRGR